MLMKHIFIGGELKRSWNEPRSSTVVLVHWLLAGARRLGWAKPGVLIRPVSLISAGSCGLLEFFLCILSVNLSSQGSTFLLVAPHCFSVVCWCRFGGETVLGLFSSGRGHDGTQKNLNRRILQWNGNQRTVLQDGALRR